MKKINALSVTLFAAVAMMASCQKEEGKEVSVNIPYTFSVNTETKTVLKNDDSVEFEAGDAVSVLTSATNDKFVTANGGSSSVFSGTLTADETEYTIVYPFSDVNSISSGKVIAEIPAMQKATSKTFASGAALAVGSLEKSNASATLYNVTSVLELGVSRDDIVAVSFESKNGEKISGICELSVSTTPAAVVNGASSAHLVTEYGSVLTADTYDLAIAPAALAGGFDLTFYKNGEEPGTYQHYTLPYNNAIEFKRNSIKPLGTKDDDILQWSAVEGFVNADQVSDVLSATPAVKNLAARFVPVEVKSVGFEYKIDGGEWTNLPGLQNANHITADLTVSESGEYSYRAWIQLSSLEKVYSEEKIFYSYLSSDASVYTESFVDDLQNPTAKAWPFIETQPKTWNNGTFTSSVNGLQYTFSTVGTFSTNATQGLVLKSNAIGDYITIPSITGKTLKAIGIVRGNSNGCRMKVASADGSVDLVEDRKLNGVEGEYQVFLLSTDKDCRLVFNSVNTFNIRAIVLCYESGAITVNPEGTTYAILGDQTEAAVSFTSKAEWTASLKSPVNGVSLSATSGPSGNNSLTVEFNENTDPTKNVKATVVISARGESVEVEISQSSYIRIYFGDGATFISQTDYENMFSSPSWKDLAGISKPGEEIEFECKAGYSFFIKMISGTSVVAKVSRNGRGLALTGDAGSYVSTPSFSGRKVLKIESNDYSTSKYKKITDSDGTVIAGGKEKRNSEDLFWDLDQSKVEAGASYRWTFHSGNMTTYLRSLKIHYTD